MPEISPEDTLQLLKQLVRIPSVNPDLDPTGTGEQEIAEFAVGWLQDHGIESWLENESSGRPNAVAAIGDSDGPTLVFCAHLDTVSARDMAIQPFDPIVEGNRLLGRGSYDMKGGAASIMAAAASLATTTLGGRLLLALVADEEYKSAGAVDFVSRHSADACIVTEPSELRLVLAHNGFVWFDIETTGNAAHGSRWDLGESAVAKMGPIISALDALDLDTLRSRTHDLTGPASLHCATIDGGAGWSTYAEHCHLRVERRTIPGENPEDVEREIREAVAAHNPHARIDKVFERSPSTCAPDEAVANCLRDAAQNVLGQTPDEIGVAYWMDAAIFTDAGIPTVNIGPAGEGAHAAEEWVDVDSVVACAEILSETARRFLSPAAKQQ